MIPTVGMAAAQQSWLLGLDLRSWQIIGWLGNALFFSRFFVQWYSTEKRKQVVVPVAFWWLSLSGSLFLLLYAMAKADSVFIFAYALTWIPYIRNLIIHKRYTRGLINCAVCERVCQPDWVFCAYCGQKVPKL